ncbi:unnamed protein product, partial [Staurois parvus]
MCHSNIRTSDNYRRDFFNPYHSLILPDGRETTVYLLKDITKRYYFSLQENSSHFSITVTPCDVPIEWSILQYRVSHAFHGKAVEKYRSFDDLKARSYYKTVSMFFHYKG